MVKIKITDRGNQCLINVEEGQDEIKLHLPSFQFIPREVPANGFPPELRLGCWISCCRNLLGLSPEMDYVIVDTNGVVIDVGIGIVKRAIIDLDEISGNDRGSDGWWKKELVANMIAIDTKCSNINPAVITQILRKLESERIIEQDGERYRLANKEFLMALSY